MSQSEEQVVENELNAETELQPLPEDQVQIIKGLQSNLGKNAELSTEIEAVIREHLRTNVTPDSYGKIWNGLELYLDEDSASYLLYLLRLSNDSSYLERVKAQITERFWNTLRRIIALYAQDLRRAYRIYNENPHAWDEVSNRHTYFDYLTNSWTISFEIVKYNGERFKIEESPGGTLALVRSLNYMLMMVPTDAAPTLIDKDYLADTFEQFAKLIHQYAPGLLAELSEMDTQADQSVS